MPHVQEEHWQAFYERVLVEREGRRVLCIVRAPGQPRTRWQMKA
jgi:hypothetical protein